MRFKPDVIMTGIRSEVVAIFSSIERLWQEFDLPEPTITSVVDGTHSATSLHYAGCAIDLRTRDFPSGGPTADVVARALRERLTQDYDVLAEKDHIHLEWQPRKPGVTS